MKKVFGNGLLVGLVLLIVSFVFSQLSNVLLPSLGKEYMNGLYRPWSDPIMSLFFLYPFVLGVTLAYAWNIIKTSFKGKNRALRFALMYCLIATLPGMFVTFSSFYVSAAMIASWTVSGIVSAMVASFMLVKLNP